METEQATIILSRDEALVLDDLLSTFTNQFAIEISHPAQRRALWNLACLIEKELVETFKPDYKERLAIAKKNLTTGSGHYQYPLTAKFAKLALIREDTKFPLTSRTVP
jgi:hypothetical protein